MRLLFFIVAFDPISLDFFIFCWITDIGLRRTLM